MRRSKVAGCAAVAMASAGSDHAKIIQAASVALVALGVVEIRRIDADSDLDAATKDHAKAAIERLSVAFSDFCHSAIARVAGRAGA